MSDDSDPTGITVVGRGEAAAPPDLATITVGVSVLDASVSTASAGARDHAEAVLSALDEEGIDRTDVSTVAYSVHPEYDHHEGAQRLLGYRVTNRLLVKVRDVSRVGDIVDRCVAAAGDAAVVDNVEFSIDDDSSATASAREAAWADASKKAGHLATLAGSTLGPVVSIVESAVRSPGPFPTPRFAAMAESTPFEGGTTTLAVTLVVRFGLA